MIWGISFLGSYTGSFFFKNYIPKGHRIVCEKIAASLHKGKMSNVYKSQALLGKPAASLPLSSFVVVV